MYRLFLRALPALLVFLVPFDSRGDNNAAIARIQKDLGFLASEECEGRGVETQGINKAADYIAKMFQDYGLKPGGKDGSYFQPFTISGPSSLGQPNSVTLRGPLDQTIEPVLGKQFQVSGLSAAGKLNAEAVFVGYGITSKETKFDDYAGVDVAGKWVIALRKTPRPDNKTAGFPEAERFAPLIYKIANAQEHKAAGIIFINDRKTADETDDLMPFNYTAGAGGATGLPVLHFKRTLVDQMLSASHAVKLNELEDKIDTDLQPQSRALTGWKISAQTTIQRKVLQVKNVVGVLEGQGPLADETIIIGGHYDHLGRGEVGSLAKTDDRKLIHFGADDNASGTTGVLELARRFGGMKNRQGRRIVFMTFSGEERGLLGSRHYCDKEPLFPLDKTVAMINLDMIGRLRPDANTGKDSLEVGGTGTAETFDKMIDRLNEKHGFQFKKTKGGLGPSDHASFYPKGVPVFFFFTGLHPQYHRPTDIPETINVEGLNKIVDLTESLALEISQVPERPKYVKVAGGLNPGGRPSVPSIRFQPGNYDEAEEKGVLIGGVTKDGPADKAGLKEGDFIVEIAGKTVKNMDGYMSAMSLQKAGQAVEFTVDRKGKKLKLTVTPQ